MPKTFAWQSSLIKQGDITIPYTFYPPAEGFPTLLFVYGGSTIFTRDRIIPTAEFFREKGYGAALFDFRGSATPEIPAFAEAGLYSRAEDLNIAFAETKRLAGDHVIIVAQSMGAYLVTHLLPEHVPERLALIGPAAYHKRAIAEKIPFGTTFTALIRQPKSYLETDIEGFLTRYTNPIIIFEFADDDVVPREIPFHYWMLSQSKDKMVFRPSGKHANIFADKTTLDSPRTMQTIVLRAILEWLVGKVKGCP